MLLTTSLLLARTPPTFDWFSIALGVVAGLSLFLYGVSRLAEGLQAMAEDRTKEIIRRFTSNPFAGVATGTLATMLLDSSSVTIIMVIALVHAGLLNFQHSLAIVMGSNIGTTLSSQLVAFEINQYAPVALAAGFGLHALSKADRWKQIGLVVFGVGLLFFGLDMIGKAVEPFKNHPSFINWIKELGEQPWLGALVGAAFTVLVQSSSATLGIVITLAGQGMISLPTGISIMLGAEIGTCADTIIATLGKSREALRTGLFHLLFNVTSVLIGLQFTKELAYLSQWLASQEDIARQIAHAHVVFNVAGTLLFLGFTPFFARMLCRLIPTAGERLDQRRVAAANS